MPPTAAGQAAALTANDLQSAADAEAEKEKMYVDTLQKIVNARVKLERQQSEFDQLALDLQVRLPHLSPSHLSPTSLSLTSLPHLVPTGT